MVNSELLRRTRRYRIGIKNFLSNLFYVLAEVLFAKQISKLTLFPYDDTKMYYFVREGYIRNALYYSRHSEGFAETLKFYSELGNGRVYIDNCFTKDVGIGDTFTVDVKPEYRLKCIRFLL